MQVREATIADADAIAHVLVHTFLIAHRGQIPEPVWLWRQREWTPLFVSQVWARLLGEMARGVRTGESAFVAETTSGAIVGVAQAGPVATDSDGMIGEVTALYVHPDHQGHGIGRQLLHAAAAHQAAQGRTMLQVGTLATNTPARRFYEAMGATLFAEREIEDGGHPLREVIYRWSDIDAIQRA